jgi:hypothetical protein
MKIELSAYEREFIISLLKKTSVDRIVNRLKSSYSVHPDHPDYIEFELTIHELEELVGELSYEANHNKKKQVANLACEIADSLESQLCAAKRAE